MEKTRATTIQQRFGFADDDLKTSKHKENSYEETMR